MGYAEKFASKRFNDAADCRTRYSGPSPKPGRRRHARALMKAGRRAELVLTLRDAREEDFICLARELLSATMRRI
jgi:hypothetical protein